MSLLNIPWVIGADWFQYYDEPTHGRFDGENFNFGLVDIQDRPYAPLTSGVAGLDLVRTKSQPTCAPPDAAQGVPPAPRKPLEPFEPLLALKHWDRARSFIRPASEFPLADLYVCWGRKAIYLGLCAQDVVEDVFYRGKLVPATDRAEWHVSINGRRQPIRGRIGAGLEPIFDEAAVRAVNISGLNGNVRNIAALELPAKLFGKASFRAGDRLELTSTFMAALTVWTGRASSSCKPSSWILRSWKAAASPLFCLGLRIVLRKVVSPMRTAYQFVTFL